MVIVLGAKAIEDTMRREIWRRRNTKKKSLGIIDNQYEESMSKLQMLQGWQMQGSERSVL